MGDKITTPLGMILFLQYWTKLCVFCGLFILKCSHFCIWLILFYLRFSTFYPPMHVCSHALLVYLRYITLWCAYENFRLGKGVVAYPMTSGQGLSLWNHASLCRVLGLVVIDILFIPLPTEPLIARTSRDHF